MPGQRTRLSRYTDNPRTDQARMLEEDLHACYTQAILHSMKAENWPGAPRPRGKCSAVVPSARKTAAATVSRARQAFATPKQKPSALPKEATVWRINYAHYINEAGDTVIPALPPLPEGAERENCYYGFGWLLDFERCKSIYTTHGRKMDKSRTIGSFLSAIQHRTRRVSGYKPVHPWMISVEQPHLDSSVLSKPNRKFEGDLLKSGYRVAVCFAFNVNWFTKHLRPKQKQYIKLKRMYGDKEPVWFRGGEPKSEWSSTIYSSV